MKAKLFYAPILLSLAASVAAAEPAGRGDTAKAVVSYADLDLTREADERALQARLRQAAARVCPEDVTDPHSFQHWVCRREALAEANRQLEPARRKALAESKTQLLSRR